MVKIRISKFRIVMALLFISLVLLVDFARRDMQLDVDLLRESLQNMPGMVMENIQMSREFSGDIWSLKVPELRQEGSTVSLHSIDITRQVSGDQGEWYFFGHEGVFSTDQMAVRVNRILGTIEASGRTWNVESARLDWRQSSDSIVFPEGLTVYDSEFLLQTSQASIDKKGVILLQGGVIKWIKPSEW